MYKKLSEFQNMHNRTGSSSTVPTRDAGNKNGISASVFGEYADLTMRDLHIQRRVKQQELSLNNEVKGQKIIQYNRIKRNAYVNRMYISPNEMSNREEEIENLKRRSMDLQNELSEINRKIKEHATVTFDRIFVEVCRELLAPDIFQRLAKAARFRMGD